MFAAKDTLLTRPSGGYQISRSLRFNSADSAYLNRTPASAGNRTTWTWSGWLKRSALGANQAFFAGNSALNDSDYLAVNFLSDDSLSIEGWNSVWRVTTQVFRDVSAWYHIVVVWDTTQATAANRVKLYINNVQVTSFIATVNPSLNATSGVNTASPHYISTYNTTNQFINAYITEINFIDGQALTPSSFGEINAQTGVWQPKAYSGSYGTNGFYLNFSDNSNTTAATLGKDYSGNSNNWTPNNFSVTAGVGNDSLVDSPTSYGTDTGVGGTVRGNYATLNAVSTAITLSNGNLAFTSGATNTSSYSTIGMSSGKWYAEVTWSTAGSTSILGVALQGYDDISTFPGNKLYSYGYDKDGLKYNNNSASAYGATFTSGDTISLALDVDAGTITYYKNGSSQGTAFTGLLAGTYFIGVGLNNSTGDINFGQRPFAYTAPSGFKALCTQNLPTPTIGATSATLAGKYYNAVTYTGTGTSNQSITGVGFAPDFVWIKCRSQSASHALFDQIRGVQQWLGSNSTSAETTYAGTLDAFGSDGFTVGSDAWTGGNQTYVAWNWKANGSGSTNTAGSITSTVSANTTSGFSVATFTKNATTNETIGHGLGVAPSMIIVKARQTAGYNSWAVWHTSIGIGNYLELNTTAASQASSTIWNNTLPTSTVFSMGTAWTSTVGMVAYCFAEVAGYSKFGSYTGNGSTDGPFVFTGFRPAFLMIKRTDNTSNAWMMYDDTRNTSNLTNKKLATNLNVEENNGADLGNDTFGIDLLSNGFKSVTQTGSNQNASGGTYIYMAFAEFPFKYSLAR